MKNTELRLIKIFSDLTLLIGRVGGGYYWVDLTEDKASTLLLAQMAGEIAPSPERLYLYASDQAIPCGVIRSQDTTVDAMPEVIDTADTVILNDGEHAILHLFSNLRMSFNRIGNGIAWLDITDPESSSIMADSMLAASETDNFNDLAVYQTCLAQGIPCGFIRPMAMLL